MNNDSIISVKNLTFKRGVKTILNNLSFDFKKGDTIGIVGTSGCGKTTLLNLITAQLKPNSGTIEVFGQNLCKIPKKDLYEQRRKMSVLFQSGALFTDISVFDNVAFPLIEFSGFDKQTIRRKALEALEDVGLRGAKDLMPSNLSGGMMRRVAFARAIVSAPKIVMFDEPFAGQDPISKAVLVTLIEKLKKKNITSILISHDIKETMEISDDILFLYGGNMIANGPPKQIENSDLPEIKQFLNGHSDGPISFHTATNTTLQEDLLIKK
jgi:phospholipid/cholesterol/gamma-HCH transport system ATP-binding protein